MSFYINHIEHRNYILVKIEDTFTEEDLINILDEITNSTEYSSNINVIYDLTDMSFSNIDDSLLASLASKAEKYGEARRGAKTVYVCPEDIQFGMARVWEVLNKLPVEKMIKRTMDEAVDWLDN